jgi:PTH1 family peptidyl-tRNA hydrolase
MKLIVGLGNPGKEYEKTRHNIGFIFLDKFAESLNLSITKEKFNGLYAETIINDEKILLLNPLSYMNLSGEVIIKYVNFYKIKTEDILIINDDLDMEFGRIRLKSSGSSGGHNGLKNIELHLNTKEYKRLKFGIANNKQIDTKDYVLGKFSKDEYEYINEISKVAANILKDFCYMNFESLMAKYNRK